jgi:hypothetical protein
MEHAPEDGRPRQKRSKLGEDLATRTARAIRNARHQKSLDLSRMKQLVAEAWKLAQVQAQQAADHKETEFVWTFNYGGKFVVLKPDLGDMRNSLPDELTEFHNDPYQQNCINIGHDKVACEFNIRLYWSPRAHEIVRYWDYQEAMSAASLEKAAEEAAEEAGRLGQF